MESWALTYQPDAHDEDDGCEGQGLGGLIDPGHRVHKTPHDKERQSKEGAGEDHIPHPVVTPNLLEEVSRNIAGDAGSEGIQQDCRGVHGMVSVHIEHPQQSHHNDGHGQSQELTTIPCKMWSPHAHMTFNFQHLPMMAHSRDLCGGKRNTSVLMIFQP